MPSNSDNRTDGTVRAVQIDGARESSPLIPRSSVPVRSSEGEFSFSDCGRSLLRNSVPNLNPFRARSSSSETSEHGVDINSLHLGLARFGSIASASGFALEPGWFDQSRGLERSTTCVPAEREYAPSENYTSDVPVETTRLVSETHEDEPESKFIGISPGKFWLVFSVIMVCYFVACFDSTLMASSHPVITSYFDASQAASWLSTVFLITSTAFQPLFGRLSDTIGRKPVFLASISIFALTTLWCALAPSIGSFIAARAVCGLGAGGTMSMSLIIVSDLVRIEDRGVFQSHINVAFGLGSASGAAFGGFLCDYMGWRWSFGVQVPFLCLCFIAAALFTPASLGPMLIKNNSGDPWLALRNFDSAGSVLLLISVTGLILGLNLGGSIYPWVSAPVITSTVVFFIATIFLVMVEKRAKQPVVPLRLLSKPPIANMVFANFLGGIASNTVLFNVPIFFQAVLLTSASSSGFRLAIPSLVGSLAGVSTGYIITYTRRLKPTLAFGAGVYLLGSVAVMFLDRNTSEIVSMILIMGVPTGQGFVFPNTMMSALAVSEQVDQAVVTTTIGLWRSLGVVMGVAVSSVIFQNGLLANLQALVQGADRDEVIRLSRSSIESIRYLAEPYQSQVVDAYALSLKTTFSCTIVTSVIMVFIIFPIRLPHLKKGRNIEIPPAAE